MKTLGIIVGSLFVPAMLAFAIVEALWVIGWL